MIQNTQLNEKTNLGTSRRGGNMECVTEKKIQILSKIEVYCAITMGTITEHIILPLFVALPSMKSRDGGW